MYTFISVILDKINIILAIVVSLTILYTFFRNYKKINYLFDEHLMKLYVDNCTSIKNILDNVIKTSNVKEIYIVELKHALHNANLYLSKDIQNFIRKIIDSLTELLVMQQNKSSLNEEKIEKMRTELKNIGIYYKKLEKIYRKHILND